LECHATSKLVVMRAVASHRTPQGSGTLANASPTIISTMSREMEHAATSAHAAAEAVARTSYGKLVAFLAVRTHDVASAEDALSEAFAAALADWPANGTPASPEAWLLTVARRKLIDAARRNKTAETASPELQLIAEHAQADLSDAPSREAGSIAGETTSFVAASLAPPPDFLARGNASQEIPDRRLALMFACSHPAIDASVRAPLILQTLLGLDAKRIASAFLVAPAAMGKRLVRAKEKIRVAGVPLEIPERDELAPRLDAVLDAIYAAFAEGWNDPVGADAVRADLASEALYLARLVASLLPQEPEALGLLALILFAHARRRARRDGAGEYVPLAEQDVALWDAAAIAEANAVLARAAAAEGVGRFQLEAALQSAHAHRTITGAKNWGDVVALYDALFALTASPVVAINRAVALAEVSGDARAGIAALPDPAHDPRLETYQPYWAARADLLARTGEHNEEARRAYDIAIGLEHDPAVRTFLLKRHAALAS
jgi:predicted RNA polymerase sigma factor